MNIDLKEILEKSKTISDIARYLFGNPNYTNREKCKKILLENDIDWQMWLNTKKNEKEKRYCLYCGKELNGDYRKKFCNHSCSASYNNKINNTNNKNYCLYCGKELNSRQNKYCSQSCKKENEHKIFIDRWKKNGLSGCRGNDGVSSHIKRYFFEKYDCKCQKCGWGEKNEYTGNVPLQIHHIDGDCTNNKEENLQLLCPNCHSLTDNFGNNDKHKSNRIDRRKKYYREEIENDKTKDVTDVCRCIVCGKKLKENQVTFCSAECKMKQQRKNITKEDILSIFSNKKGLSYAKVAEILGISTTTLIRKCNLFDIKNIIQKLRYGK